MKKKLKDWISDYLWDTDWPFAPHPDAEDSVFRWKWLTKLYQ